VLLSDESMSDIAESDLENVEKELLEEIERGDPNDEMSIISIASPLKSIFNSAQKRS
jgi:hypothetical protein